MFCLDSKVIEKYRKSGNILLVENGHGVRNILVFHKELYRSERGLIYTGYCATNRVPVAFKVVPLTHRDNLIEEYMIMRFLCHENILKVWALDFSVRGHSAVMTMDVARCDLYALINLIDEYVPLLQLDKWMEELISAVNYVHSNDYVHGDLNYKNVLITEGLCIKIADFGSADKRSNFKLTRYDPLFVPPELSCRLSEPIPYGYDPRLIDVWSIGVLMFYALTKQPPFTEVVTKSATDVHGNCPGDTLLYQEDRERCSVHYSIVLSKLMDFNVKRRPQLIHVINQNFFNQPLIQDQLVAEQIFQMFS